MDAHTHTCIYTYTHFDECWTTYKNSLRGKDGEHGQVNALFKYNKKTSVFEALRTTDGAPGDNSAQCFH